MVISLVATVDGGGGVVMRWWNCWWIFGFFLDFSMKL